MAGEIVPGEKNQTLAEVQPGITSFMNKHPNWALHERRLPISKSESHEKL